MTNAMDSAIRYAAAGLSVLPILADESKAPAVSEWRELQWRRASEEEIRSWYASGRPLGVAILGGAISGNLLVFDFDLPGYFDEWAEAVRSVDPDVLGTLPIIKTPTGYGRHVYLRTEKAIPGAKLAKDEATNGKSPWEVAIETRGEGQYVLAPGSPPECHEARATYDHIAGPFPEDAPILAADTVSLLIESAKALNRYIEVRAIVGHSHLSKERVNRPGDDYCRRGDWEDLLLKHGWEKVRERGQESFWRRPGKEGRGISATLGHCRTDASGPLLYVFSSNAGPFEADRAYNLFGAFTILEFGGDFHAAAVRLAADGYGEAPHEEILAQVESAVRRIREKIAVVGEGVALLPRKRIDAPMKTDPKFKRTWNRSRPELSLEQTRYDTSLLWYGRKLNFTIEEMIQLVYDHRIEHGCAPEHALESVYMAKKIGWVFSSGESEEATLAVSEAQQVIDGGEDNVLREIRTRTSIKDFKRVIQRGEEEEMYCLELEDGRVVEIGKVQAFREKQKQFISQIYRLLHVNMEELKGYEWKALHDLFLKVTVVERYPEDDPEVMGNEVVGRYLQSVTVHVIKADDGRSAAAKQREPFVEGGRLMIHFGHLWEWILTVRPREKGWGYHRLRSILQGLGFKGGKVPGPYPRVYHSRPVDDFPGEEIMERIRDSAQEPAGDREPGSEA